MSNLRKPTPGLSGFVSPNIVSAQAVQNISQTGRKMRRPTHTFSLQTRPYQIQPFLIAPVLPGETMKNLLMQTRVVTDPIASAMKLVGWWTEYYFFYVKLTDLDDFDDLSNMLVNGGSVAGLVTASDVETYHRGDGLNFTQMCLDRVTAEYFRDDGEAILAGALDGLPLISVGINDFTDSLILDSATPGGDGNLPGENPGVPAHMAGAWADSYAHWQAMRDQQVTEATFEDWLRAFGVSPPREEREDRRVPELIRYVRDWQYPSNTVNPTDGTVASAVSWSIAERADKDRFCQVPGFIFGVTVARPKVYMANLEAAGAHYLDTPYSWLPAVLQADPYTSVREFADTGGPLAATMTANYWIDMRDLFVHGDQFINYAHGSGVPGFVELPAATAARRYAASTEIDAIFAGANKKIRQDGRVDLSILSRVSEDTSL